MGSKPSLGDAVAGSMSYQIRGGTRSFLLAYSARAGFNTLLLLFTALRRRKLTLKAIIHALYGDSTLRFGSMLGLFSLIYRFLYHTLRLYNPGPRGQGKEERWHAPLAGAVASIGLLAERRDARLPVAQQVFVRGLQGLYHRFKRRGLHIPHGDVILFGLACGQIMYAWLMSPKTLSRAYHVWITDASNLPRALAAVQRARAFREPYVFHLQFTRVVQPRCRIPLPAAKNILETWRRSTPGNLKLMQQSIDLARRGNQGPPFALCAFNHPSSDGCIEHLVKLWPIVFRWMLPVYAG
jgi:hypothetical protein